MSRVEMPSGKCDFFRSTFFNMAAVADQAFVHGCKAFLIEPERIADGDMFGRVQMALALVIDREWVVGITKPPKLEHFRLDVGNGERSIKDGTGADRVAIVIMRAIVIAAALG